MAEAVETLELDYVVLTSVTRDDLADGGAAHLCTVVETVRRRRPGVRVELLIPDFGGDQEALTTVLRCQPDVVGHNLETVPRLYGTVRPEADYQRSLEVLGQAKVPDGTQLTKSAVLLGLGETQEEVLGVLCDLRSVGCDLLVLGQYLQPSREHLPVWEYWTPGRFARLEGHALAMGFRGALCRPLARSSYQARGMFEALAERMQAAGQPQQSIGE